MRPKLYLAALILIYLPLNLAAKEQAIGHVKTVQPEAVIVREGRELPAEIEKPIYQGDTLITRFEGTLGIIFIDGAVLTLGPSSLLIIDEFIFKPAEKEVSFLTRITKGTVTFLAGAIGRISPQSIRLMTPTAEISMHESKVLIEVN